MLKAATAWLGPVRTTLILAVLLLAGCVSKSPGGATVAPSGDQGPYMDFNRDVPGLSLEARAFHDRGHHSLSATAANDGDTTYYVRSVCYTPWETELRDEDDDVFVGAEPLTHCGAIGWDEFKPGDVLDFSSDWREQRWDPERERLQPADAGTYTWAVLFAAQTSQDSPPAYLRVTFTFAIP